MRDADPEQNKRVYGRGLFDGLRMAGVENPEEFMQASKLVKAEQGLNGVMKKVLDAVPISEAWSKSQVVGELRRTGHNIGADVVESCLNAMRGKGLITEPVRGTFKRIAPKQKPQTEMEEPPMPAPHPFDPINATEPARDPLSRMADVAKSARSLASALQQLASEVEEIAIASEERLEQISKDTEKLRQLQQLLKTLSG
jgi:hypothetical protein